MVKGTFLSTSRLYEGKDILDFTMKKLFKEGDEIISIEEVMVRKYTYLTCNVGEFFFDLDEMGGDVRREPHLTLEDLAKCKFILLPRERLGAMFLENK